MRSWSLRRKKARRLLHSLPRWGSTGAGEIVDCLVAVGFLESTWGGSLSPGDEDMARLWAAIGTASAGLPRHRLGSPEAIAVARWWPALGVTVERLASWLAALPPMQAVDGGRVLVASMAATSRESAIDQTTTMLAPSRDGARAELTGLWAAAVCGVASTPMNHLGVQLSRELVSSFPVASRRLAALLPPLDAVEPYQDLRGHLPPAVATVLDAWEPILEADLGGESMSFYYRTLGCWTPGATKDTLVGVLCPVQVFPREMERWVVGGRRPQHSPQWGPEDFEALEDAACAGDSALAALLAGHDVPAVARAEPLYTLDPEDDDEPAAIEGGHVRPSVSDHPWSSLPAGLRLRWLGRGLARGTSAPWGLLKAVSLTLRGPIDMDALKRACEAVGPQSVEERFIRALDTRRLGSGGWPFEPQVVVELARRIELRALLRHLEAYAVEVLASYPVRRVPGAYERIPCWVLGAEWRAKPADVPVGLWDLLVALDGLGQRAAELLHAMGDEEPLRARAATTGRLVATAELEDRVKLADDLWFGETWDPAELLRVPLSDEAALAQFARWRTSIHAYEGPHEWSSLVDDAGKRAAWLREVLRYSQGSARRQGLPLHLPADAAALDCSEGLTRRALLLWVALHEVGARDLTPEVRAWIHELPHGRSVWRASRALDEVSAERADEALRALAMRRDRPGVVTAIESRLVAHAADGEGIRTAQRWVADLDRVWREEPAVAGAAQGGGGCGARRCGLALGGRPVPGPSGVRLS